MNLDKIFGKLTPPPGPTNLYRDPVDGLGRLIVVSIQIALIVGAIFSLLYLLWGAIDWIASGSDKDALQKAQTRMRNAAVGIIMIVVSLTIFIVLAGNVLNIIQLDGGGFQFNIPRF